MGALQMFAIAASFLPLYQCLYRCDSTAAITTCHNVNFQSNQDFFLKDYKPYLEITNGNIPTLPKEKFKNFAKIKQLSLARNSIDSIKIGAFKFLDKLENLNLYDNKLTSLDGPLFRDCQKLSHLILGMNKIDTISSNAFEGLNELIELDLSFNKLRSLPPFEEGLTKLEILKLNDNQIEGLGNELHRLNNLKNLNLGTNRIKVLKEDAFSGLKKLKVLHIKFNDIEDWNLDWALKDLTGLKEVALKVNRFSCGKYKDFARKLKMKHIQNDIIVKNC